MKRQLCSSPQNQKGLINSSRLPFPQTVGPDDPPRSFQWLFCGSVIPGFPSMGHSCGSLSYSPHGEGRSAAPEPVGGKTGSRGAPGPWHFTVGSGRFLGVHRITATCPHGLAGCHGAGRPIVPAPNRLPLRAWPRTGGYHRRGSSCVLQLWHVQHGSAPKRAPDGRELAPAAEAALPTVRVCPGTVPQLLRHSGQGSNFQPVAAPAPAPLPGQQKSCTPRSLEPAAPAQPSPPRAGRGFPGRAQQRRSRSSPPSRRTEGGGSGRAWEWV